MPEDTTYKRGQCRYSTKCKHLAQMHTGRVHCGRERCKVCFKQLRKRNIKEHCFLHMGEMRISCDFCDKKFIQQNSLKYHVETWHFKRCRECKECGKTVKHSRNLSRHMKTVHAREPHHIWCSCSFNLTSEYVRHVAQVHVGEKNEKCPVCGKGFFAKSNLRRHILVRTEEKQYLREVCGKAFAYKCNARHHTKTHSEVHPFKCDLCGGVFKRKRGLAFHVKAKHV